MGQLAGFSHGMAVHSLPTDLLPTMAIFRCFCCGGIVSELFLSKCDSLDGVYRVKGGRISERQAD